MKKYGIALGLVCVLGLSSLMAGCGKEETGETVKETVQETETEEETETELESETEEIKEEQVIGEETADAYELLITNNMGQNIIGIAIKGITEEEYSENMLKEAAVLADGDTAKLYYSLSVEDEGAAEMETETDLLDEKLINELYTVQLTLEDKTVVELINFGFDDMDEVEICYEDEVGFIRYISKETKEEVSTKEMALAEKTRKEAVEMETTVETNYVQPENVYYAPEVTPEPEVISTPEATPTPEPEVTPVQEAAPEIEQNEDGCLDGVLIND